MTALKKYLKVLFFFFFVFLSIGVTTVEATTDVEAEAVEEARKDKLREILGLELPVETDNPNFQITFTEPDGASVEIKVDAGKYSVKKSPYTLESLSIGKHTILFKFEDEDEVEQVLEETLIVIPRVPVFSNSEDLSFSDPTKVEFSGTALPNSTVVFLISSDLTMQINTSDSEGNWTLAVEDTLSEGDHEIVGFVRKDGYASDFCDPVSFYVGSSVSSDVEVGEGQSGFPLKISIDWSKIFSSDNRYYFIGAGGVLLLIVFVVVVLAMKGGLNVPEEAKFEAKPEKEKMTLREKLMGKSELKKVKKQVPVDETEKKEQDGEIERDFIHISPPSGAPGVQSKEEKKDASEKQEIKDTEKEKKVVEKEKKRFQISSIFGFLKKKKTEDGVKPEKVIPKDKFMEDYKDGELNGKKESKLKDTETKEPVENKYSKSKGKKSNSIEVTLG